MKKPRISKSQKQILQFLADQGGTGYIVAGFRWVRTGELKLPGGGTAPAMCVFGQTFDPMLFGETALVERVGDYGSHCYRALYSPDGEKIESSG